MLIENSLLSGSDKEFDRAMGCFKSSCVDCDEKEDCDGYREIDTHINMGGLCLHVDWKCQDCPLKKDCLEFGEVENV